MGWENFGPRYLAFRLPIASEEIRDPHNFVVRIVAELGIVGGFLLAIGLLRLAWETTQFPARPPETESTETDWLPRKQRTEATQRILLTVTLAILLNFFLAIDLNSSSSYILIEGMRRSLFWLLLIVGISAGTLHARLLRNAICGRANWNTSLMRGPRPGCSIQSSSGWRCS